MASRTVIRPLLQLSKSPVLRAGLCPRAQTSALQRTAPAYAQGQQQQQQQQHQQQVRWHSAPASDSKVYDFSQIKSLVDKASEDRVLIDVREPGEYSAGYIPTALNVPISSQPDALMLPAEEFEERFGFEKPAADKEVVFYCKAGVRSSAAARLAMLSGYEKVGEYRGSWLDWEKQGGSVTR